MAILRSSMSALTNHRFVLANLQHHARAPDETIINLLVHADNESGENAGWQNRIGILKGRDTVEVQFSGFIFGEQVRDFVIFGLPVKTWRIKQSG